MPLQLTTAQRINWADTFREHLKTWEWIAGSFKPTLPDQINLSLETGRYFFDLNCFPTSSLPTRMNCWEAVLISGILAGIYTKEQVIQLLEPASLGSKLITYMRHAPLEIRQGDLIPVKNIFVGSIIMFGDGAHFALSLGGEKLLNLDRSQKGEKTISALLDPKNPDGHYFGDTYMPLRIKRPPAVPEDIARL